MRKAASFIVDTDSAFNDIVEAWWLDRQGLDTFDPSNRWIRRRYR